MPIETINGLLPEILVLITLASRQSSDKPVHMCCLAGAIAVHNHKV